MLGLIGKKIGMTQLFDETGAIIPVTAIQAGPCPIVQVRTEERDGYRAVQLGFGAKKPRRSGKPETGHAAKASLDYVPAMLREFPLGDDDSLADDPHSPAPAAVSEASAPVDDDEAGEGEEGGSDAAAEADATVGEAASPEIADPRAGLRVGQVLTVSIFEPGERIRVTGDTKGRGFQGVIKRHRFAGFPKSHGHPFSRVPGSIGSGTDPSRVIKGRKMAGRMGGKRRTLRNLDVVKIDPERNLIFVRGSVPGAPNGWVFIRKQ